MQKKLTSKKPIKTYCGYIAIIGRPNVGKSTLLNNLLRQKISITSRKPQTTRHCILGIKTEGAKQIVFVDTPGIHLNPKHVINHIMIKEAVNAIQDVDAILFVIEADKWTEADEHILKTLDAKKTPIMVLVNKVDKIKDKRLLLPYLASISKKLAEYNLKDIEIVPISAKRSINITQLEEMMGTHLPEGPHLFPEEQITDKSERFLAAEFLREQLMRFLGQEVPHALTVEIEKFQYSEGARRTLHLSAIIWIERPGQKAIILGKKGERLKEINTIARIELERFFDCKVFLQVWIKLKEGWTDDIRALQSLGYGE